MPRAKVGSRFKFDVSNKDFEDHCHGFVPAATTQDTQKCVNLFEEWVKERNRLFSNDKVPENILFCHDKTLLCKWLCRFVSELRKKDGTPYPPKTLHHYLVGLQRHIRQKDYSSTINITSDVEFRPLRNLEDSLYRSLHAAGVGKKTEPVTAEDEEHLWSRGVLDPNSPQGLLNCFFFEWPKLLPKGRCGITGLETVSV